MVQRPAPKSSLDLLCEVALAPGDAIVSELVANDLRNEAEKAAKHAGSGGGVLDLDEILKLTPKQLVRHFTVFESNELRRTFKHTCRLVPYECQYETSSFGSEAKSVRDIKQHLQEHLELLKAQSTGRITFTAETTVPIPRRLIEPRQGKKQPAAAKAPPRETRPSFIPEPAPAQPETPPKTAVSPKRALARRTSPPERPSRRVKAKRPRKRPVVESPPPELVSQPPEQQWGHTVEPLPPPPPSDVPAPAPVSPPPQPPPPPPPPPPPSPPRPLLREHDYARDAGAEVAPPSSGGGGVAKTLLSSLLEGALKSESVSADAPAAPGAVSVGASVQQTFEPDAALMGLMEREVMAGPAVVSGGSVGQTEYSDGVPLVGAEQVVRAGQSAGVIRSGDLPVIMQGGSATIAGLRRYTRVVERDEYKEQRKPKGLAKFISQSEEDKEKARQALIEMRMRPSMCNNYVCRVCFPPQRFTALSSLQSHYKSHLGIKEFSCKLCQRSFTRKMSLDYHMLIHQHKTRYRCDTCGHEFRHKSHYTEHLRRHTGETPYVCSVCGQGFKAKNSYRRHLESKHGQRLTQSGNIVILSDDEHRRLRERSVHEERSRRRRSQPRPSDGGPAPDSPSKTGFSFVDVVVRQSTGRVEYMCNVDSAVPPLVQPTRDVLQQALDAALPEVQMLPPLTPEAEPRATEQDPLAIEQDLLATYPLAIEQQPQPQPKHEPREPLPARPRVNLTSSIGKYSVYYSSGNVANTLRIVRK